MNKKTRLILLPTIGVSTALILGGTVFNQSSAQASSVTSSVSKLKVNEGKIGANWGTCEYTFSTSTGILKVGAGNLGTSTDAPWNRDIIDRGAIKEIDFESKVIAPSDANSLLKDLNQLETIKGLPNLDTSKVTDMGYMFYACYRLTNLDLSHFDTSNVTDMKKMFIACSSLTSLDLGHFDTSKVTNMNQMFYSCGKLTNLDLSHFDASKVTDMENMFGDCKGLTSLDLSHFNTSNVTNMRGMFSACSSLTSLDLSHFDTSNVTNMGGMFSVCSSLTSLDLSHFDTSNVTAMNSMFSDCKGLISLDLSHFDTSKVTDMNYMFSGNPLESITLGSNFRFLSTPSLEGKGNNVIWTRKDGKSKSYTSTDFMTKYGTGDLTAGTYVAAPLKWGTCICDFDESTGILKVGAGNLGTSTDAPWNRDIIDRGAIKEIDFESKVIAPSDANSLLKALSQLETIKGLPNFDTSNVTAMNGMFCYCGKLTSLDLSHFDTSKVTDMTNMFVGCSGLTNLNVSHFDTSNVTDMNKMFSNCIKLTSLDLSHFNTSKVTNMGFMFSGCYNLTSLDLSHFDTSKVTDMSDMFSNCLRLLSLDMSHFNTSNVTEMNDMFFHCYSLTSLDLSHFDTSKVTAMSDMFEGCSGLTSLDLSHFDTSEVTNMNDMFYNCSSLTSLDLSHFNTSNVIDMNDMFYGNPLESITLGSDFRFLSTPSLSDSVIEGGKSTGRWIRADGKSKAYSPEDFISKYGTGDLTAGTYVGEVDRKATLSLSISTDKSKYTIGDNINTTILIEHNVTSEDQSTARDITLSDLDQYILGGSQELPSQVTIKTYDANDKLTDTKSEKISRTTSLPDLKKGNYYKVIISGKAVNNTDANVKYNMKLSYSSNGVEDAKSISIEQSAEIDSGALRFLKVPDNLEFTPTVFSIGLNNRVIDRTDKDWGMTLSDLRGTVPHGKNKEVDRQNWKIYATAKPFKDESGEAVVDNALAMTYVKNGKQTDLSAAETLIESHDVKGETPEKNQQSVVHWEKDEGIKAIVHDRSKISSSKKYSSDMTFEVRIEP